MSLAVLAKIVQIIVMDIVLSGDNAVVIAMAAHKLPAYQRQRAILWGGGIAVVLRVVFTALMAFLLMIPGVRLVGGLVLAWIACKLLLEEEDHAITPDNADKSTLAAIRMIFVADFVMSLDNMLAVAGAAGEDIWLLVFGLLVSIGIIMFFSSVIARLMNRFKIIVYLGAAILAYTAGEMMIGDRELAHYFAQNHQLSLNKHWEHDFMIVEGDVADFQRVEDLPADLRALIKFRPGHLEFVGQMTGDQRNTLLEHVATDDDKHAVKVMYDRSHRRDVPEWVPDSWRARVEPWFQRRWPGEVWKGIQGRQYHYVAWIWYGLVITFCMTSPYWLRGRHSPDVEKPKSPAA